MRKGLGKGSDLGEDIEALVSELDAEHELSGHNENWLVSYADMMTLLFGFFAMLYLTQGAPQAPPPPPPPAHAGPVMPEAPKVTKITGEDLKMLAQGKKPPPEAAKPAEPEKKPEPSAPKAEDKPLLPKVHSKDEGSTGGNRGFFMVDFFAPELLIAFAIALAFHFFFFRLGERRRRLEISLANGSGLVAARQPPPLRLKTAMPGATAVLDDAELFHLPSDEEIDDSGHETAISLTDERWLISYADLMTLLFGFFAMLYLMGPNFEAVKKAMEDTFTSAKPAPPPVTLPTDLPKMSLKDMLKPPEPVPVATVAQTVTAVQTAAATSTAAPATTAVATTVTSSTATVVASTIKTPSLQEMEEQQWKALRARVATNPGRGSKQEPEAPTGAGNGGGGSGGGQGKGMGSGAHDAAGTTICEGSASMPFSPTCRGGGFFGCLDPQLLSGAGGQNGDGGALEFYCEGGRTRVCLTWERCPWRPGHTDAGEYSEGVQQAGGDANSMQCSPYGLAVDAMAGGNGAPMARCRPGGNCGFSMLYCDGAGRLTVEQ